MHLSIISMFPGIYQCAVEKELPLPRVESRVQESTTSSKPSTTTSTGNDDVTVTSSHQSSSASPPSAATTRTTSGNMLMRRRGLATTALPSVLQIALVPRTTGRGLYKHSPPPRVRVNTVPSAFNVTSGAGVGYISTPASPAWSNGGSTGHGRVNDRTRPTVSSSYTTARYSAMLSATDLMGK